MIRKDRGLASRGGELAIYIKQHFIIKFEKIDLAKWGETEILGIELVMAHSRFCLVLV